MKIFTAVAIFLLAVSFGHSEVSAFRTNSIQETVILFEEATFSGSEPSGLPAWITKVGYEHGAIGGITSAWYCASDLPEGKGKIWFDINRKKMNENIAFTLFYETEADSDIAIQLMDSEGKLVAIDLFKSALKMAREAGTDTFIIPFLKHPSATKLVIRRISGEVKLYGVAMLPVLTEMENDLDVLTDLAKLFGDPLSSDSDVMRRIKQIAKESSAKNGNEAGAKRVSVVNPVKTVNPVKNEKTGSPVLDYGGFKWSVMRTDFEVKDDTIFSVPRQRPGFDYGHSGNGRGAIMAAEIGSQKWKDYSLELDICSKGADKAFNPYGLNPENIGYEIFFRVVDFKESWNDKSTSALFFGAYNQGTNMSWCVGGMRNFYAAAPRGFSNLQGKGCFRIFDGTGVKLDREKGNHVRIDVKGANIKIWFDEVQICDLTDARILEEYEGVRLDHGGFGVAGNYDTMWWARNIKCEPIK